MIAPPPRGGAAEADQAPCLAIALALGSCDAPAARARKATAGLLDQAGREDLLDDARLVVTELVANAIRHASGIFDLRLTYSGGRLRIELSDPSTNAPQKREAAPADESGRGIAIISALTSTWGFDCTPQGKTVWAELA